MNSLKEHWNTLFARTDDEQLGWYEADVSQTVKFLTEIPEGEVEKIFIPGVGTSTLVDELFTRGYKLILNDISDIALSKLKTRLGKHERLEWCQHDLTKPMRKVDLVVDAWVDRAVLHFLSQESEIKTYFENVHSLVRQGGWVLLAQFSPESATRCAGLDIHRYSLEEMNERLGEDFKLMDHELYTYHSPFEWTRSYLYALYKRI